MTREEAIAQLKMDRNLCNFNPMTGEEEPMNEDCRKSAVALDMAIKLLEQEPCEDCVSRQAVLYALDKRFDSIPMEQTTEILLLRHDLRKLPPVTPLPKGHGNLIDKNELLEITKSYKSELGGLKADPFVKCGIETVERFIKEMSPIIEADKESEVSDGDSD